MRRRRFFAGPEGRAIWKWKKTNSAELAIVFVGRDVDPALQITESALAGANRYFGD